MVVVVGFFVVVVAAGFLVVSAAVADAGLFVAEPVLFAGLLDVAAEELLSCLFVEGFDVSEEASDELFCLSELSADELFCLSELSDDELFCLSELILSEASDEVSEDEPLPEEAVSCDTVSAEDTAEAVDELSADNVPLSALQPQADMISAAHSIREMIRFFIFLFLSQSSTGPTTGSSLRTHGDTQKMAAISSLTATILSHFLYFGRIISIFRILHRILPRTIHWKSLLPELLLPMPSAILHRIPRV